MKNDFTMIEISDRFRDKGQITASAFPDGGYSPEPMFMCSLRLLQAKLKQL